MKTEEQFSLPEETDGSAYDLDGVLIDTVRSDVKLCRLALCLELTKNRNFSENDAEILANAVLTEDFIRPLIHVNIPDFWDIIIARLNVIARVDLSKSKERMIATYNSARTSESLPVLPGARDALDKSRKKGRVAIVSTNLEDHLRRILANAEGGALEVDFVIGTNTVGVTDRKPSFQPWQFVAEKLEVRGMCMAVEDSSSNLRGIHTGSTNFGVRSRWHLVGMETGSATSEKLSTLKSEGFIDAVYTTF
ncbi:MAG: HAD family hydrolase [Candidatus Gracilibacteria bacterium]